MKRTFAMLLALTIIVSLAACGTAPAEEPDGSHYNLVLQPSVSNEADASDDAASADDTMNEPTNEGKNSPASGGESTPPTTSEAGPAATVIPNHQQELSESENQEQEEQPMDTAKRIRFLVGEDEIIVRLEDNPAADSLYEMLPMELSFEDYNGTEKIAYPDEALTTDGAPDHCTPQRGDLCFYAPWGNLCFFYRDFRESPSLVPLGMIESGIEYLETLDSAASVTVEAVK